METLKTKRKQKGLTQSKLARMVGLSQTTIHQLEAGDHNAKAGTRERLERVLGKLTWDEIYGRRSFTVNDANRMFKKFKQGILPMNDVDRINIIDRVINQLEKLK